MAKWCARRPSSSDSLPRTPPGLDGRDSSAAVPACIRSPFLDFVPGGERDEDLLAKALVAQPAVEALDKRILDRLSRYDELQLRSAFLGPLVECPAGKFQTVVRL